jgi:hypothetical protein
MSWSLGDTLKNMLGVKAGIPRLGQTILMRAGDRDTVHVPVPERKIPEWNGKNGASDRLVGCQANANRSPVNRPRPRLRGPHHPHHPSNTLTP